MKKYVLSVGDRMPVHIEIINVDDNLLVSGELHTYRLDYGMNLICYIKFYEHSNA